MKNLETQILHALTNKFGHLMKPMQHMVLTHFPEVNDLIEIEVKAKFEPMVGEPDYYEVNFDMVYRKPEGGFGRTHRTFKLEPNLMMSYVVGAIINSLNEVTDAKIGAEFFVEWNKQNENTRIDSFRYHLGETILAFHHKRDYDIQARTSTRDNVIHDN